MELTQNQFSELSIYKGELNKECIFSNVARIKKAFPALPIDFFDVFDDRLQANNFNDDRLNDAVNYVIDTCIYPTPTIAQFISFDRKFKVCSYEEMVKKTSDFGAEIWKSYIAIKFPDREKNVWVHVDDAKRFNLKT